MTLSVPWLTTLFFITIRLGTMLLFTPIQAIRYLPIHARLLFTFSLSFLLTHYAPSHHALSNNAIILGALAEFSNGLILAASLYAVFALFQIAGQLIDNQTGLNSAALFNPGEHSQEALTSHLLSMLAVLFFFSLDGHHYFFQGIALSLVLIPPGTLSLFAGLGPVIKQFGFMFSIAFTLASPIILALLAVDLCGALITRNMPQVSTYFLTLPVKILLGLLLLFLLLTYINPLMSKIFVEWFHTWQEIMS